MERRDSSLPFRGSPRSSSSLPSLTLPFETHKQHNGSADEETTAPRSPKTLGRSQSRAETHRTVVLFLSGPEEQKLRFQGADHSAALRGPVPPNNPRRTRRCRAAPTGWTALRVALGRHRSAKVGSGPAVRPVVGGAAARPARRPP